MVKGHLCLSFQCPFTCRIFLSRIPFQILLHIWSVVTIVGGIQVAPSQVHAAISTLTSFYMLPNKSLSLVLGFQCITALSGHLKATLAIFPRCYSFPIHHYLVSVSDPASPDIPQTHGRTCNDKLQHMENRRLGFNSEWSSSRIIILYCQTDS